MVKIVIEIPDKMYSELLTWKFSTEVTNRALKAITNGAILPPGAHILTDKAYSNLCLQASRGSKRGRWVLAEMGDTDLYECSLCKTRKTYKPPFCPQCGAKMEGE